MRKVTLLLTGTVNVGLTRYVELTDPKERYRQYCSAIKRCLEYEDLNVVFCENSGADLVEIKAWENDSFEVVQFSGSDFDGDLGKGYGEALIIEHALKNSRLLSDADLVIKITGRYFVHSVDRLKAYLQGCEDIQICCNLTQSLTTCYSVIFVGSKFFFEKYFLPNRERINDSAGVYFEHVLADSVLRMIADHTEIIYHPVPFFLKTEGVYGTNNEERKNSLYRNLVRRLIARLKFLLIRR